MGPYLEEVEDEQFVNIMPAPRLPLFKRLSLLKHRKNPCEQCIVRACCAYEGKEQCEKSYYHEAYKKHLAKPFVYHAPKFFSACILTSLLILMFYLRLR